MPSFMDLQVAKQAYSDDISLKESTNTQLVIHPKSQVLTIPLPLPPSKKFLSNSPPTSATSSPRLGSMKWRNQNQNHQPSPLSNNPLARQNSVALTNLERLKQNHLRRSSSCVEGRSSVPPEKYDVEDSKVRGGVTEDKRESYEEKFKCGAMCLFIPGLGKAKPVRARRVESAGDMGHCVSRKVSMEKFECGSWTSSAIIDSKEDDEDESNHFFDLPVELIRCSVNDTHSSVTAAFVFDKEPKGVLKNNTAKSRSSESTRHVRFSTSSPDSDSPKTCITPRLQKAREDFNAFLEAQCA